MVMCGPRMLELRFSAQVQTKTEVSPNGDVAGAVTDFVINLNVDMDPAQPGKALLKGQAVRIKLPEDLKFKADKEFPIHNLFGAPDCSRCDGAAGDLLTSIVRRLCGVE